MQLATLSLALGAQLFLKKQSFAEYYCNLVEDYEIQYRFFKRNDVRLYDEALVGTERDIAKLAGIERRDTVMEFFSGLAAEAISGKRLISIHSEIRKRMPEGKFPLPSLERISYIGDGTCLEFDSLRFIIRASGTDAVLRYYVESKAEGKMMSFLDSIVRLKI